MTGGVVLGVISVTVVLRRTGGPHLGGVRGARVDRLRNAEVKGEPQGEGCCHDPAGVTTHAFNLDSFRRLARTRKVKNA